MKKLKLFAMAALMAVGGLSLTGCSENKQIVEEAAKRIPLIEKRITSEQLQLPGSWIIKADGVSHTVTIDWSANPSDRITFERSSKGETVYANIVLPDLAKNEADEPVTFTATVSYEKAKVTRDFNSTLAAVEKIVALTTAQAKAAAIDEDLLVKGVAVDAHSGGNGFFLVDETGVIYVYDKAAAHVGSLNYGSEVIVKGKRAQNTKQLKDSDGAALGDPVSIVQMTYESFTLVTETKEVPTEAAVSTTVAEILSWGKDPTQDNFVNHSGEYYHVRAKIETYGSYTPPTYEAMDENGKYLNFYANTYNDPTQGYVEELEQYIGVMCDIYLAIYDISTSSSNKTTWRTVPVKVVPVAA